MRYGKLTRISCICMAWSFGFLPRAYRARVQMHLHIDCSDYHYSSHHGSFFWSRFE